MNELLINLDASSRKPLYEQIYEFIKGEIIGGSLSYMTKLPSTRSLASQLLTSRSTILLAYDQLLSEGYIDSIANKGYYVNDLSGLYSLNASIPQKETPAKPNLNVSYKYDFSPSGINLDNFPYSIWRKLSKNVLSEANRELFNNGDPQGEYSFRATICNYLNQSRGMHCTPEQIIVGAGNEYLLTILHQLLDSKTTFAIENPTYAKAYKTLKALGRTVNPIPMDDYGITVEGLLSTKSNVAYITPSHQYPLGIIMPVKRRNELLSWAIENDDCYIIEDDYDSEFRYKGHPIPALSGSDTFGKVIYLGTFSKSIAPAIRMSYMVLPEVLLSVYHEKCAFLSCTVSRIDQQIVETFINDGYYERHLNRMRAHYKALHDVLLEQVKLHLPKFEIAGDNAGLHILISIKSTISEASLIECAKKAGIRIYPLSQYYIKALPQGDVSTFIIGYANLSEEAISEGIKALGVAFSSL